MYDEIINLVVEKKWVALAALTIGLVVRLLKSDKVPAIFAKIPAKARVGVALVLGGISAGLERVASGTEWKSALIGGLVAAALAVLGHQVFIEWLRGGKELLPKVLPPSIPPPARLPSIPVTLEFETEDPQADTPTETPDAKRKAASGGE